MEIDIRTLIIILGITHLMQVLVFFHQFRVNKYYRGIGWWLLWSAAEVIGFGVILLRGIPSILPIIIIIQNSMIVAGTVFLYVGIKHFLNKPVNLKILLPTLVAFLIGLLYFLFIKDNIQIRSGIISAALAFISFLTAYSLFVDRPNAIKYSANFNAIIFLIHGGVFVYRMIMISTGTPVDNIFSSEFFNLLSYFDALIVSLIWTFGLIIMLNQRLNTEMLETKGELQLIFNTSPDAAMITRLEDGLIIDVNESYSTITGYSRNETIGKLTTEVNFWKNTADRQRIISHLKKQGHYDNFEAPFLLKNGAEITGLMSAKVINIHNAPYVISITRDISDRKQMEEKAQSSELRFRLLFENMNEGVALHEMIYNDSGIPVDYRIVDINSAFEFQTGILAQKARGTLATKLYGVENPPYLSEYNEVVNTGKTFSFETHFPKLNKDFSISAISTKPGCFATIFQDITEHKQKEAEIQFLLEKSENSRNDLLSILEDQMMAQESLKVSEERYRNLLTNLEAGVVVHAPNTSITMNNQRASELLGLNDDQMKGRLAIDPQWKFIAEDNTPLQLEDYPVNRVIATRKPFKDFTLGVIRPPINDTVWLSVNGFPVINKNDKIIEILISFIDITERKQFEEKLRENLALLRIAGEKAKLGGWSVNLEENRTHWSDEVATIHEMPSGYSPLVEGGINFYAPEWRERITTVFTNCAKNGVPYDEEMEIITAKGKRIWIQTIGEAVKDTNGKITSVQGAFQDISDRKQAEETLRQSEDKFKYLFDHSVLGKSITFPTGEIHVNKAFCDITGYSFEELQAKKWQEISHPEDIKLNEEIIQSLTSGEKDSARFTKRYIHKKGSIVWAEVGSTVRRDINGKPLYFITVVNDITDRKRTETQLNLSSKILSILNEPLDLSLTIPRVLTEIKQIFEFDAIGFRLKNEDDFPFLNYDGFSNEFISQENTLLARNGNGAVCKDKNGNISLECTCGLVISGNADPENPLFTKGGSAWTNDSFPFLNIPKKDDPRLNPRNRCIHEGYRSIALIPIRANNEIIGILQLNDRKKDRLTLEMIHFLEGIGSFLSMALMRKKQTEALLFKNLVFDVSLAANSIADLDGLITEVNNAFLKIWGYTNKDEVIGKPISEFIYNSKDAERIVFALQEHGEWEGDYTAKKKDGSTFIVHGAATIVKNENGSNIGYQSAVLDITERKKIEETLNNYTNRLKNLHIIDQAILKAIESPEAIVQTALLHIRDLLSCQRSSVGIFNFEKKEVLVFAADIDGKTIFQVGKILPEDVYGELETLHKNRIDIVEGRLHGQLSSSIIQIFQPEEIQSSINIPLISAQKLYGVLNVGWLNTKKLNKEELETVKEVAGQITIAIEQAHLLQETKNYANQLEDRIIQRTSQLETANKELEAFSYSVSHDLRAPLRHINGYVELLNRHFNSVLPEKGQHFLNSITNSVHMMGALIDDLLQFSRMGRKDMLHIEFDMSEVVQEVKQSIYRNNPKCKVEWVLEELPKVNGDRAMIQLVWINLINNAVKFTGTRKKPRIEIGAHEEKEEWVFFISDNGVGFDMQYAHKLFGVFQRLHPIEEFEGTGIGLANVRRIISRHGGRTWAEAELDKGAKIYFSLPKK